jgi:hypothetical protein
MTPDEIKGVHTKAIFLHDRTCCVCRNENKRYIQVHHIDDNHDNNDINNLAVLCNDCHTDTQIKGGFFRKLDSSLIHKYRDEWLEIVEIKGRGKGGPVLIEKARSLSLPTHPLESFISQFYEQHVLPLNSTFYFEDYYVSDPTGLNLVVVNLDLTFDNIDRYRSILKAYMLCILGDIAPPRSLKFNSLDLSKALRGVIIDEVTTILVPTWNIPVEGVNFLIHILGYVNAKNKQIILTFCPLAFKLKDQDKIIKFISKIEEIIKPIIGLKLDL